MLSWSGGVVLKQQFSKFVRVLFLIAIIVIPTVQSEVIANNSEVEGNKELEPVRKFNIVVIQAMLIRLNLSSHQQVLKH
jgi:hypothetical protein